MLKAPNFVIRKAVQGPGSKIVDAYIRCSPVDCEDPLNVGASIPAADWKGGIGDLTAPHFFLGLDKIQVNTVIVFIVIPSYRLRNCPSSKEKCTTQESTRE